MKDGTVCIDFEDIKYHYIDESGNSACCVRPLIMDDSGNYVCCKENEKISGRCM